MSGVVGMEGSVKIEEVAQKQEGESLTLLHLTAISRRSLISITLERERSR